MAKSPRALFVRESGNLSKVGEAIPPERLWMSSDVPAVFNPMRHGAKGNGSHDDFAAGQSAIQAAEEAGGIVCWPQGNYRFSEPLIQTKGGVQIIGSGFNTCFIPDHNGNVFHAVAGFDLEGTSGLEGMVWSNFRVRPATVRTAGWVVYAEDTTYAHLEKLFFGDYYHTRVQSGGPLIWNGIFLNGAGAPRIYDSYMYTKHHGIALTGRSRYHYDGFLAGLELWGTENTGGYGIHLGGGNGGVGISRSNAVNYDEVIRVSKDLVAGDHPTPRNRELFMGAGVYVDNGSTYGVHICEAALEKFQWTDVWCCGNGRGTGGIAGGDVGCGIYVEPQYGEFWCSLVGGRIYSSTGDAIRYRDNNLTVNGVQIHQFGKHPEGGLSANGGDGIRLENTAATRAVITNNIIADGGKAGRGAGIRLPAGFYKYVVANNLVDNTADAHVVNPNTGVDDYTLVSNNTGALIATTTSVAVLSAPSGIVLGTSWTWTGLGVAAPAAGKYAIRATVRWQSKGDQFFKFILRNETAGTDFADTLRIAYYFPGGKPNDEQVTENYTFIITVGAAAVIRVMAQSQTGNGLIVSDDGNGNSTLELEAI